MAKLKTQYVCQDCGTSSAKWQGRCSGCGNWNTLVEEIVVRDQKSEAAMLGSSAWTAPDGSHYVSLGDEDTESAAENAKRIHTGIGELDRVLGGGLVRDSFILLGGDPGIGKSTLVLQITKALAHKKIFYVSGEESISQIRSRAKRLGVGDLKNVYLAGETVFENVLATVTELQPDLVIMDSLQTFTTSALESAPGSVGQVREVAARLMNLAKTKGIAVILVGHVTKDGNIAGPKVVEHMVDTVLYFEGDSGLSYRMLRAVKNRFGSVRELGVFEMTSAGLMEVKNPSALFLGTREAPVSGTAVAACLEGTRPIFVEIQALVAKSSLAMPRRNAVGIELARLGMLAAILERHMGLSLSDHDVFVNVAGGYRIQEPSCDLAMAAAIWSSLAGHAMPEDQALIGELSLTGEVRPVSQIDTRVEEAKKLGFRSVVVPKQSLERLKEIQGIKIIPVSRVSDLKMQPTVAAAPKVRDSRARQPDASV